MAPLFPNLDRAAPRKQHQQHHGRNVAQFVSHARGSSLITYSRSENLIVSHAKKISVINPWSLVKAAPQGGGICAIPVTTLECCMK